MNNDALILRHIGRYRISVPRVLQPLFFGGDRCDDTLQRLTAEGHVHTVRGGITTGIRCYRLTVQGAQRVGLPESRGREVTSKLLRRELAILWFCCVSGPARLRLERSDYLNVAESDQDGLKKPHIAEAAGSDTAIHRLFVPGPETKDERLIESVRTDASDVVEHPELGPWVARGTYRFTVLIDDGERTRRLRDALKRRNLPEVIVRIETVPALEDLRTEFAR